MYQCKQCGYKGKELIFQFNDYSYCMASNEEEPEYTGELPKWVKDQGVGDSEIGEPVGCPQCHNWGVATFEEI